MAVMIIVFFISFFYLQRSDQMQQKIDLLFEKKIGCVANLLRFNDGQREILKTAAWISLNDLMLTQPRMMTDNEIHVAQWLLVLKIGKNVETFLEINKNDASKSIWNDFQDFSNTQTNDNKLLQLIDYMVERCQ